MTELFQIFKSVAEMYGEPTAITIIILVGLIYFIYKIVKNSTSLITRYIEMKLLEPSEIHKKAADHRKNITPEIRKMLLELGREIDADRTLLFEYSNGNSNLVGLPFLYITATCEVLKPHISSVSQDYQRINTSLFAEFLETLEDRGLIFIEDIESIKTTQPIMYNMMKNNGCKCALFYSLSGMEDSIGFLVVTKVDGRLLTRDSTIPKMANISQRISSLLNFDKIHETRG